MTAYEKICDIIKENLCLEEDFTFTEELTFNELQADSLDMVEIIMAIEDAFNVEISDDELEEIKNLGELAELVSQKAD